MSEPAFDSDDLFDESYLQFFRPILDDEQRLTTETELITRLLDLPAQAAILDLACGHGRLSNRLAGHGYQVTGLDAQPTFLERAHEDAHAHHTPTYLLGDMRELPWTDHFDAVLSWFTSFGYFHDDDNRRVLAEIARALVPGGRLLMDLNNYPGVLRTYQQSVTVESGDDLLIDQHEFDPTTNRNTVRRTLLQDGSRRTFRFSVRMFTFPEIRDWLNDAGFTRVEAHGDDGAELTMDSRRMRVLAHR